jgi:predicted P-loop ATPase
MSHENWRGFLPMLEGLPLLPCGAGDKFKIPLNPETGEKLHGWEKTSYTFDQIAGMNSLVRCVGFKPGPDAGLLVLDIDGATAVDRCVAHGVDFHSVGWRVTRNTTNDRLKVVFRVPPELHGPLSYPDGTPSGKAVLTTKKAFKNADGSVTDVEQIEMFWGTGQCIVLGEHKSSNGLYEWIGSPQQATEPTPEWWAVIYECLAKKNLEEDRRTSTSTGELIQSGPSYPCPICGRDHSGACTTYLDNNGGQRRINCFRGQSFSPPLTRKVNGAEIPLELGDRITRDGIEWAYAGEGFNDSIGEFSKFVEHRDRPAVVNPQVMGGAIDVQGRRNKLQPDEVMALLPVALGGQPRMNIRNGDVVLPNRILDANSVSRLYLRLSSPTTTWPKQDTADALTLLASENAFDPVHEYLEGLETEPLPMEQWNRLDQHLLGFDDPIAASFLPRYLMSAVARIYEPGCDYRQTLVLVGAQWRGKSALGRILFGRDHWVEGVGDLGRDALLKCQSGWGIELAELDGVTRRADQEKLKAFLTETVDNFRAPYDRASIGHPRRFVFWATSNAPPLRDATGSTRFVTIGIPDRDLPLDWTQAHRDAIWARAVQQYKAGVEYRFGTDSERIQIAERNEDHTEADPWTDEVVKYLGRRAEVVTVPKLLDHLGLSRERQNNQTSQRVRQIAEKLGWRYGRRRVEGIRFQGLFPPASTDVQTAQTVGHSTATSADLNQGMGSAPVSVPSIPNIDNKYIYINREVVHRDKKIERFEDSGVDSNSLCLNPLRPNTSEGLDGVAERVDSGGHPKTSFRSPTGHDPKNPLQGFGRFGASE